MKYKEVTLNKNETNIKEMVYYSVKLFNSVDNVEEIGDLILITKIENSKLFITLESKLKDTYCHEMVELEKKTYLPIFYSSRIIKDMNETKLQGHYNRNNVILKVESQTGVQNLSMKITKKNTFDNTSAYNIVRAISAGLININNFYLVNFKSFSKIKVNIKMEEDEEIQIHRQNYFCRAIKLSFDNKHPNLSQRFLVQKEYPHLLVKNISGPQVIKLERYTGGKNVQ
jgi:hypothetical protein